MANAIQVSSGGPTSCAVDAESGPGGGTALACDWVAAQCAHSIRWVAYPTLSPCRQVLHAWGRTCARTGCCACHSCCGQGQIGGCTACRTSSQSQRRVDTSPTPPPHKAARGSPSHALPVSLGVSLMTRWRGQVSHSRQRHVHALAEGARKGGPVGPSPRAALRRRHLGVAAFRLQ